MSGPPPVGTPAESTMDSKKRPSIPPSNAYCLSQSIHSVMKQDVRLECHPFNPTVAGYTPNQLSASSSNVRTCCGGGATSMNHARLE